MTFRATNNHDEIRRWVEGHGGTPAVIRGSADPLPSLSIIWRNEGEAELEEISWDEFFDAFETGRLSFRYSPQAKSGDEDSAFNFVGRDTVTALDNQEFIFPEENEMARENMFPSAPAVEEGDAHSGD